MKRSTFFQYIIAAVAEFFGCKVNESSLTASKTIHLTPPNDGSIFYIIVDRDGEKTIYENGNITV